VHASEMTGRFSALATVRKSSGSPEAAHAKQGSGHRGKAR
jgi:hypothetical protein